MKLEREQLKLYGITDRSWTGALDPKGEEARGLLLEQVEAALKGGITILQIREKDLPFLEFYQEALAIKALCKRYGVPLIINDNVELALKVDADGVHIGQSDMELERARELLGPDKIIGVTAKTVALAQAAEAAGADYLGSGAVFGSSTKTDARAMDHELFQTICESVSIPVVAIGGIDSTNIEKLKGRKMAGFAVVSGIFAQKDIEAGTRKLRSLAENIL